MCVCAVHMCMVSKEAVEVVCPTQTGIIGGCELSCSFWESNPVFCKSLNIVSPLRTPLLYNLNQEFLAMYMSRLALEELFRHT